MASFERSINAREGSAYGLKRVPYGFKNHAYGCKRLQNSLNRPSDGLKHRLDAFNGLPDGCKHRSYGFKPGAYGIHALCKAVGLGLEGIFPRNEKGGLLSGARRGQTAGGFFTMENTNPPPVPAPLQTGDSWGFYKVVECSPTRVLLRADYASGVLLLVLGALVLGLDVLVFSKADFIVNITRGAKSLYTFRDFLLRLPAAVKGAMIALPLLGFGWFFFMTGRSITVDFLRNVARRVKFFVIGTEANLALVTALQLRINDGFAPSRGDNVCLHLLDAQGRSLMVLPDETASADDFDSTPTTDFAKLLSAAAHLAKTMRVPIALQGEPATMSPINRAMLASICPRG